MRRYRVYLICAVVIVVLFVRISRRNEWPAYGQPDVFEITTPKEDKHKESPGDNLIQKWTPKPQAPVAAKPTKQAPKSPSSKASKASKASKTPLPPKPSMSIKSTSVAVRESLSSNTILETVQTAGPPTIPQFIIPDRIPPSNGFGEIEQNVDDIHPIAPPGRQEFPEFPPEPTTVHWQKQIEHFPVPTESLIHLPTGQPVQIPQIQHAFSDETSDAKITREKRQAKVRNEFRKAWGGYKKYAWLHDELSPVSGKFRDPFCGWAATLVDALDTLWIMGLQDEFEEAVKGIELIDFTTSPRGDIPVFETTIRYLGGLLAAYDVSGARYKVLLDKAVELGDILMGAFDTPNRMPVLYYRWKPAFASQPHRASQRSNLAELGSLSMEFTRLAQLTHNTHYYDAVARVTNALNEWQDRGTILNGIFPENVDASGCNRSAELITQQPISAAKVVPDKKPEEVVGYEPPMPTTVKEPRPHKDLGHNPTGPGTLEFQIMPGVGEGEPAKGKIVTWDESSHKQEVLRKVTPSKRDLEEPLIPAVPATPVVDGARGRENAFTVHPTTNERVNLIEAAKAEADPTSKMWDCVPQGLASTGSDKFSMGGGQDSTYEYFPKEYLLLGGLEAKYKKMYIKTIDAVRKWLLYRPMLPENRDVLFTGSIGAWGVNPVPEDLKLEYEIEHLTCFIGGMVGMGAKIFDIEGDLEIAKKLTDGCVWAYGSTASGIMPEGGLLAPCKSAKHCAWNETEYHLALDPIADTRDENVKQYLKNRKARLAELEAQRIAQIKMAEEDEIAAEEARQAEALLSNTTVSVRSNGSEALRKEEPASLQKRQWESSPKGVPTPVTHNAADGTPRKGVPKMEEQKLIASSSKPKVSKPTTTLTPSQQLYEQKSQLTEDELRSMESSGRQGEKGDVEYREETEAEAMLDPSRPPTHDEYVAARIKQELLPPGYTVIRSNKYILRPEAIESVWYMYRITGDKTWQDKGWKMFEAVINATSAEYGHSAIIDVTAPVPTKVDEMESFWLSETLKYFYLLFSTPETISLDEWVLNTEAHPFKRPLTSSPVPSS